MGSMLKDREGAANLSQFYDALAPQYDALYVDTIHYVEDELVWQLSESIGPLGKVLSVGCGTGNDISILRLEPEKSVCVDFSKNMLRIARKKYPEYRFELHDVTQSPFRYNADTVVALYGVVNYIGMRAFVRQVFQSGATKFIAILYANGYTPYNIDNIPHRFGVSDLIELRQAFPSLRVSGLSYFMDSNDIPFEPLLTAQKLMTMQPSSLSGCKYWVCYST